MGVSGGEKVCVAQYGVGRVFLVGNAAHCHSPVGGRGMNLGIADGTDLARRMVEDGLEDYGEARHKLGKEIIAGSEAVRKVITSRSPVTRFLVLAVLRTASFMRRYNVNLPRKSYMVDLR